MGAGVDYATAMHEQVLKRINDAAVNLQNIQLAKQKIKQDQEEFNLKKKVTDAQIKHFEFTEGPEAAQRVKETHDAEIKTALANINLINTKITAAETENQQKKDYFENLDKQYNSYMEGIQSERNENIANQLAGITSPQSYLQSSISFGGIKNRINPPITKSNPPMSKLEFIQENLPAGTSMDFGGNKISAKKQVNAEEEIKRIVSERGEAALSPAQKEYYNVNMKKPTNWEIQKEARARVNALLQNNFALQAEAMKNPDRINQMVDSEVLKIKESQSRNFQPESLPKVMPDNLKKTSEMVDYLMKQYGTSKEKAIAHLKQLYSSQ